MTKVRLLLAMWIVCGASVLGTERTASGQTASLGNPAAFSGVYPRLAVTNAGPDEVGIGAIMPWADKLWYVTYPAHVFLGGIDKLYELDAALHLTARPESVGGTIYDRSRFPGQRNLAYLPGGDGPCGQDGDARLSRWLLRPLGPRQDRLRLQGNRLVSLQQ